MHQKQPPAKVAFRKLDPEVSSAAAGVAAHNIIKEIRGMADRGSGFSCGHVS
jgi:hypothetical protein